LWFRILCETMGGVRDGMVCGLTGGRLTGRPPKT
jgi:hypothetical protein